MTDQELTLQAVSKAQSIIEEYLQPRPHNHERLLDRLLEVLDRSAVLERGRRNKANWPSPGDRLRAVELTQLPVRSASAVRRSRS